MKSLYKNNLSNVKGTKHTYCKLLKSTRKMQNINVLYFKLLLALYIDFRRTLNALHVKSNKNKWANTTKCHPPKYQQCNLFDVLLAFFFLYRWQKSFSAVLSQLNNEFDTYTAGIGRYLFSQNRIWFVYVQLYQFVLDFFLSAVFWRK